MSDDDDDDRYNDKIASKCFCLKYVFSLLVTMLVLFMLMMMNLNYNDIARMFKQ